MKALACEDADVMTKDFAKLACSIGKRLREMREPVERAPLPQKLEELLRRLAEREGSLSRR
jgi:hypothetical protein